MAQEVFFHVGALKSGTTYLQRVMWANRDRLRDAGVLIPGKEFRDRVWATQTVRERSPVHARAAESWGIIVDQVNRFPGDAIISHEYFGLATARQAQRAMADVHPAEVHVVYTARDLIRVLPALWQERVKFRHTGRLVDFEPEPGSDTSASNFGWAGVDVVDALRRWGETVPPSHVHVVTVPPPGAPREVLWQRFAEACQFDPEVADLDLPPVNESMGAVEAELLRRINPRVGEEIRGPREVPHWIRTYLGIQVLASRGGLRFGLSPTRAKQLRERSVETTRALREAGYDIVGDLDDLLGDPDASFPGDPDAATDSELLETALDVIARMLSDYREVSLERKQLRQRLGRAQRELRDSRERARRSGLALRLRTTVDRARRRLGRMSR